MTQGKGTKFLFDNYIQEDILANYEVSSEQASYPVENAFNFKRRSKAWRSNGYFKIRTSNNGLVFRESEGGSDLLASVIPAEYNNYTSFLGALEDALNLAGTNNYTVSYDNNKKIVIESDGSYFEMRGANVLSTIMPVIGFDSTNEYYGYTEYAADVVRVHTSEWIKWDTGVPSRPNAFAFCASKILGIRLSPNSQIILRGNSTDPENWDSPEVSFNLEYNDEVIAKITEENFSDTGCRYWMLELIDIENPIGYVEVGAFFLGKWFKFSGGCATFPLIKSFKDRTETNFSEGGQSFSELKPRYREFSLQFQTLNKEDMDDLEFFFETYGTGKPFFMSVDTDSIFSTSFQRSLIYCKLVSDIPNSLARPNEWQTPIIVREEF